MMQVGLRKIENEVHTRPRNKIDSVIGHRFHRFYDSTSGSVYVRRANFQYHSSLHFLQSDVLLKEIQDTSVHVSNSPNVSEISIVWRMTMPAPKDPQKL